MLDDDKADPKFDIRANLALPAELLPQVWAVVPRKIARRRERFIAVPWSWLERLEGANGKTYHLALHLLYLHWKDRGQSIKLANGMLRLDGVSRKSKWRGLNDLEKRGLITVERRPRRTPIVRVLY
jgi:hypothetical protein